MRFAAWARHDPRIVAAIRIGSRVRGQGTPTGADEGSDYDFQVVTTVPEAFASARQLEEGGVGRPLAYVLRPGRFGSARKVSAVFADGELDVVPIPLGQAEWLHGQLALPEGPRAPRAAAALQDLAAVIAGGYEIFKGAERFGEVYARVRATVPPPRLTDDDVRECAEAFVCDYVSTCRKLARGELLATQRWLHHHLAETNFRLLHELQLRRGQTSFPDARRVERLVEQPWPARVGVDAALTVESLRAAGGEAAETCRLLVRELVGETWAWPDLAPLGLGGE